MTDDLPLARRAHRALEPIHTLVYFVPEGAERYDALGVTGGMRGYFASRSAPLGVVPAEVVVATFYNFSPTHVAKAIPSVWDVTTPAQVLDARLEVADAALRRLLADDLGSDEVAEAAALARIAAESADVVGRPLFAAHAALPWPEPPHLQLWHAATLLREHRGDGHIAALMTNGIGGLEAHVLYALGMDMPAEKFGRIHHLPAAQLAAVIDGMRDRGLIGDDGWLSEQGRAVKQRVEALTDELAAKPYEGLEVGELDELMSALEPLAALLVAAQD